MMIYRDKILHTSSHSYYATLVKRIIQLSKRDETHLKFSRLDK